MTVQKGNATSIMGTLGPLRKLEDFFDVRDKEKRNHKSPLSYNIKS